MPTAGLVVGTLVGKYKITGFLGRGGMSMVYAGLDVSLLRPVAIKLLTNAPNQGTAVFERILLEARAAAQLNHPNVVTIYEVQNSGERCYLVMELVEGGTTQARLNEQGRLPWREATNIIADACRGLMCAHAAEIIHRDVKPANILLSSSGIAKLADFGLTQAPKLATQSLTRAGLLLGTPQFMSPEQCTSEELDERADIYSLGATYYALLTGKPPFEGNDTAMIMYAHCTSPLPDPRLKAPEIPEACVDILKRALAKSRIDRYPRADLMYADLQSALAAPETSAINVVPPPVLQEVPPAQDAPTATIPTVLTTRRRWMKSAVACATMGTFGLASWAALGRRGKPTPATKTRRANETRRTTETQPPSINSNVPLLLTPSRITLANKPGGARVVCVGEKHVVTGGSNGSLHVYSRSDGAYLHTMHHPCEVDAVAISTDGKIVVAGGRVKPVVSIWETATGNAVGAFPAMGNICSLAFAPSDSKLAVATETDLQIFIYDPTKGRFRPSARLLERQYVVGQVAFSADGNRLAACTDENLVAAWDWPSLKRLTIPQRPTTGRLTTVAISKDGGQIGFGAYEGIYHMWNVEQGSSSPVPQVRSSSISASIFSPDVDTVVVAGEWGGPLRVYDVNTGKCKMVNALAAGAARCLHFSADGKLFAAAYFDEGVWLWDAQIVSSTQ